MITKEEEGEEKILEGTGFKTREEVAESLAYLRREAITTYRTDEGMPPEDEVQRFRERLNGVEKLAAKLGITNAEIWDGQKRADDRVTRIKLRCEMIERAAQALASGHGLFDSEISVMNSDPGFAKMVEIRAESIRREKQKKR